MMRRLTMRAQASVHDGYGGATAEFFKWLGRWDIYVAFRAVGINEQWGATIPKEMRAQMVVPPQPEPYELFCYPPTLPGTPNKKTVMFSMWEASILPAQNVSLLNRCELVIVPSKWCAESFKESGVTKPISIVPLGFDPEIYTPRPVATGGPTVFGIAGRVAHCPRRKMIQESIDLFLATFKGVEDVRLHVKIHPDDKINDVTDKRVKIFRDVLEPYQLANWLHGLTVFVTLSRAEGLGLWPLQALACGRPVIGCAFSGHADFMTAENSFLVPFKKVSCEGVGDSNVAYDGDWAQPEMKAAAERMQFVHRRRENAILKGQEVSKTVEHLTWQNATDKLIAELEKVGAL